MKIKNNQMGPVSVDTLKRSMSIAGNRTIEIPDDEMSGDILGKERKGIVTVIRTVAPVEQSISLPKVDSRKSLTKTMDVVETNTVDDVRENDPIPENEPDPEGRRGFSRKRKSGYRSSRQGGEQ